MVTLRVEDEQLSLFGGGLDLAALRAVREGLGHPVLSVTTVKAYSNDWRQFQRWCTCDAGKFSLPASADTVALYVTWLMVECGRRTSTAARHCAAITAAHRDAGFPNPVDRSVRAIITSVRRDRRERPRGKAALEPADLVKAVRACDRNALGYRDRALLVIGFATSLRRSELARLQLADVTFEKKGLAVLVRYSKTDQEGKGRVLAVWAGKRAATDPVRVLKAWIAKRGKWDGPLFSRVQTGDTITQRSMTGDAVNDVVKRAVKRAGLDPAAYGAHSLRAGAVTAAAALGRSDQEIMGLSGHTTARVMRMYVRKARIFSGRNPLAGVM